MGPKHLNESEHPNKIKHLNVDKCSLPSIVSSLPRLFGSDHGIMFINGATDKDSGGAPAGTCWLGTRPATPPLESLL
jgi:hypothetical protein